MKYLLALMLAGPLWVFGIAFCLGMLGFFVFVIGMGLFGLFAG